MIDNTLTQDNLDIKKEKVSKLDTLVFVMCVADILFLPYIRILSVTLSMILLPLWYIFNSKKVPVKKEFQLFMVSLFFILISLLKSKTSYPSSLYFRTNLTYAAILIFGFLAYFFFKFYFTKTNASINKPLTYYLFFGLGLVSLYFLNPQMYFNVRSFWTMSGEAIAVQDSLLIHRFTSTLSDPNNASVVFVGVAAYLLFNGKANFQQSLFVLSSTLIILVATMSNTGFLLFALVVAYYIFRSIKTKRFFKIKKNNLIFLVLFIMMIPVISIFFFMFAKTDVTQLALDRVTGNSADSRFYIWETLLANKSIFENLFLGSGGTIFLNGAPFSPHNGHLHLIYNYGFVPYIIFIYIFFRKNKKGALHNYFFLIPLFLGFSVNVGIYEPRFMFLLALLSARYTIPTLNENEIELPKLK